MTPKITLTKPEADARDLGLGAVVAQESRERFLNRDGSFNVSRVGLPLFSTVNVYHYLLTISWRRFLALVAASYVVLNLIFACLYLLCGDAAIADASAQPMQNEFWRAFFFSVETFATIGYGTIHPNGYAANFLMTVESFIGIVAQALVTGLLFARFARPTAKIKFSDCAVVAPFRDGEAFMFRLVNARANQLIEVKAQVLFAYFLEENGKNVRKFELLELERSEVSFFALSWTVVHPIDERSPLHGWTDAGLRLADAEFLVLLTAFDETFSQTVHTRSSYKPAEIEWNAKFADIYVRDADLPHIAIDVRRLSETEKIK